MYTTIFRLPMFFKDFLCIIHKIWYTISMITLSKITKQWQEYLRLETDLLYKVSIGVLTLKEATDIIDQWLRARGL